MDHAQLPGRGLLKGGYLLAKDKLLRLKHMLYGRQQLKVEGLVLALQVKHGNGHGHGLAGLGGAASRSYAVLHGNILPTMEPVPHPCVSFGNGAKFESDERRG
jgi:hypothetical protein